MKLMMKNSVDDMNIKILDCDFLSNSIKEKLKNSNIKNDLCDLSFYDLVRVKGFCIFDIIELIETLNEHGYHLADENLIEVSDYFNDEISPLIEKCDCILKQRNKLSNTGTYYNLAAFNNEIEELLNKIQEKKHNFCL